MTQLYPYGYGRSLASLDDLHRMFGQKMLPEAWRRHAALIVDRGGVLGIGSSWRRTPDGASQASRNGQSFHQTQQFADGQAGCLAIDYVAVSPGNVHRAPITGELPVQGSAEAVKFGIHANVGAPGSSGWEPWHAQTIEHDGWLRWRDAGRRPPQTDYPLPGQDDDDMTDDQLEAICDRLDLLNTRMGAIVDDVQVIQVRVGAILKDTGKMEVRSSYVANNWCREAITILRALDPTPD